jgi:hypothetical protein
MSKMKRKRRSFSEDSEEEEMQEALEGYVQGLGRARDRRLSRRRLDQRDAIQTARHIISAHDTAHEILAARAAQELLAAREECHMYQAQALCCS